MYLTFVYLTFGGFFSVYLNVKTARIPICIQNWLATLMRYSFFVDFLLSVTPCSMLTCRHYYFNHCIVWRIMTHFLCFRCNWRLSGRLNACHSLTNFIEVNAIMPCQWAWSRRSVKRGEMEEMTASLMVRPYL